VTAKEHFAQAKETFTEMGDTQEVGRCRRYLGRIALQEDGPETAREYLETATDTFLELGVYDDALRTVQVLLECDEGESDEWHRTAAAVANDAPDGTVELHTDWLAETLDEQVIDGVR